MAERLKVVLLGAASAQWGHTISRDLIVSLSQDRICDAYRPELVLEDVDGKNLGPQEQLAKRVAEKAGGRVTVSSTTDQKLALEGARFAVPTIGVGTLEAMQSDLEIPQEYGIYQPVGDTISIAGAIRAARNIPAMISIARDLETMGHPEAWLLNLANPMAILCRAVTKETKVRTIGCCHELYGGVLTLAHLLGFDIFSWRDILKMKILGINHCGWMQELSVNGKDGLAMLREFLETRGITTETKQMYDSDYPEFRGSNVKMNLFLRHGVFPYSGDRHTAEFFTEFLAPDSNKGADWGVMLTTAQERIVHWRGGARENVKTLIAGKKEIDMNLSQEAAGRIIPAILLDEPFYDVGNYPYADTSLPGIPPGTVLERMVTFDASGVHPDPSSPLPEPLMAHLVSTAEFIEKVVSASVAGNRALLVEALEEDKLLQNMAKDKVGEMVGRLLGVHRRYVHPGFF